MYELDGSPPNHFRKLLAEDLKPLRIIDKNPFPTFELTSSDIQSERASSYLRRRTKPAGGPYASSEFPPFLEASRDIARIVRVSALTLRQLPFAAAHSLLREHANKHECSAQTDEQKTNPRRLASASQVVRSRRGVILSGRPLGARTVRGPALLIQGPELGFTDRLDALVSIAQLHSQHETRMSTRTDREEDYASDATVEDMILLGITGRRR